MFKILVMKMIVVKKFCPIVFLIAMISHGCVSGSENSNRRTNSNQELTVDEEMESSVSDNKNSDWVEIGEVSALKWVDSYFDGNHAMVAETFYTYCWYKLVDGEKIYSISQKGRILTKNTYTEIKVGNALSGDLSEGYSYIDVSGYKYMHQYVNGRDKMVEFVTLP